MVFLLATLVPTANADRISTQSVGFEDGLSQSTVTAIAEGPEGFLWIGTPDGLHRYDGYDFRVYHEGDAGLTDDDITALVSSPNGSLWVATRYAGLFAYTRETRRFTPAFPAGNLSGARITCLTLDPVGTLWIGTDAAGVVRLDPTTRETQRWPHDPLSSRSLTSPHVTAIATDRWGNVLVGTADRGLNVIAAATGEVAVHRSLVGIPDSLPSDRISALLVTREHRLLVGTATGETRWFDVETGRFAAAASAVEDGEGRGVGAATPVTALLESRSDDIWVATSSKVTRLRAGDRVAVADVRRVGVVYEDASGVIWFGSRAGGLSRYVPRTEQFSRYLGGRDPGGELVWSFAEAADGSVWVGTDDGLFRFAPTASAPERVVIPALGPFPVHDLFSGGGLWLALGAGGAAQIGADGGLLRRIGSTPGASPAVLSVHADESRVYLGTAGDGLHVVDAASSRRRYPTAEPSAARGESVYAIESAADGRLWLGTNGSAILRFDPQSGAIERHPLLDEAGPGVVVWGIEPTRDGSLWLAAREGGAILFHPADGVKLRLVPRVDFPADMVYDTIVDGLGGVWITTNKGLFRLDEATGETQHYTRADGLAADEFSSGAAIAASDGTIYAGGVNGFTRFDPRSVRPSLYPPPIVITHLTDSRGREIDPIAGMLPRGENGFSLTLSALDFADPAANRYSYRLVDYDDDWRSPDADRTIRYAGLPQGDYRLYLRGSNNDGLWNYDGATLDITVPPRFWQTKLFVVGMMALAIVLVSLGVYRRF